MVTNGQYELDLRDALAHLFDPTFQPAPSLYLATGCDRADGADAVRSALLKAIKSLEPAADDPPQARSRRLYSVLSCRYLEQLSQQEAAERLGITPRHLRREQREAVRLLADRLRSTSTTSSKLEEPAAHHEYRGSEGETALHSQAWHHQLRKEAESLRQRTLGSVADVGEAVGGAVEVARALAQRKGIALQAVSIPAGLTVALHPSGLRQILVAAILDLVRRMPSGSVDISAAETGSHISIALRSNPPPEDAISADRAAEELIAAFGGSARLRADDASATLCIELPSADQVRVLVIDDNPDLLHFYQRYVYGTRYHLLTTTEGQQVFELIDTQRPDIIVLDVMLPDVDGWALLTHLHDHPDSRGIPIVVCSIMQEEELSLALGAAVYVPKPVGRADFLRALGRAITQAAGEA